MTSRAGPDGLWLPVPDVTALHEGTSPMRCIRRVRAAPRTGFPFDVEASTLGTYIRLAGVDEHGGPIAWVLLRLSRQVVVTPLSAWGLDLTDATGRAHAGWWLADRPDSPLIPSVSCLTGWACWDGVWIVDQPHQLSGCGGNFWSFSADTSVTWIDIDQTVPALADLDPEDPRLLPDESPWVYAEALRRVCLHHMRRAE